MKCVNCGLLVYGAGHKHEVAGKIGLYCSPWCIEWAAKRAANDGYFKLPIVQPKLRIEEKHARLHVAGDFLVGVQSEGA